MLNIINFCPDCSTVLTYDKNEYSKLILICKRCNYKTDKNVKMRFEKVNNEKSNIVSYALPTIYTKYDSTLLKTTKIECRNPDCPTNKAELSETTMPEIILTNKSNNNRLMDFTCTRCDCSWNIKD